MSETPVLDALREVEFFRGISDEQLKQVADISRAVEFRANSDIFHEHDLANDVYLIVSGRVSLIICEAKVGCRQLSEVGPGDLVGWSALAGRTRLFDTARTLTPTRVIVMDAKKILQLCSEDNQFGFEFMYRVTQVLAKRLSATRLQLMDISGTRLPSVAIESD